MNKPFKDGICDEWANWMLNTNDSLGLTNAKNRKHPTRPNVLDWIQTSWDAVKEDSIRKTSGRLHMTPDAGPEVEGYNANEEEVSDDELDDQKY